MFTSYQKRKKNKITMEIISLTMALARVCTHMGLCLREAGTTSQQRAGPPNILL